jgi:hypothetical protein
MSDALPSHVTITWDDFINTFKPGTCPTDDGIEIRLETFGEELARVRAADPALVWTATETDKWWLYESCLHRVNALHYTLATVPVCDAVRDGRVHVTVLDEDDDPIDVPHVAAVTLVKQ